MANATSKIKGYQIVSCADKDAEVEVLKIVEGAVTYSRPARTLCLREPKNA